MRQDIPQQHTPDTELRNRNWLELPKPHNIRHIFAVFIANLITASGSIECHHNALLLSHSVLSYEDTRRRTTTQYRISNTAGSLRSLLRAREIHALTLFTLVS